jgi:hypothetical protein
MMATNLRKPFSDAYQLIIKIADEVGFPHTFDLDDALLAAQDIADRRAKGEWDGGDSDLTTIGELSYILLSYLGQPPPLDLMARFKTRAERLKGYVADGSIDRELGIGDRVELADAKRDVRTLKRLWIKRPPDEPAPTNQEVVALIMLWTAVVSKLLMEFPSQTVGAEPGRSN